MVRKSSASQALMTQLMELGAAAPVVVSQRITRLALAGPNPSRRDRREMALMSREKAEAGWESWRAMATYAMDMHAAATLAALAFWMPWASPGKALPTPVDAVLGLTLAGVKPYRRIAVANSRRLRVDVAGKERRFGKRGRT